MRLNHAVAIPRVIPLLAILLSACVNAGGLTNDSFGDITIGMDEAAAREILANYVTDEELYDEPYDCHYLAPPETVKGVYYMMIDAKVVRFDIDDKELNIATMEGVGIGSSKSDVLRVYRNAEISPHPYISPDGEYIEVKLPNGNGIIFETEHDVVTSFRLGSYPAVEYIEGCL